MRRVGLVLAGLMLIGASDSVDPPRSPEAQAKLDKWLDGRVAGESRTCVKSEIVTNAIVIDDHTMLFRDGPRIWRTELRASLQCGQVGKQSYIHTESQANRICSGQQLEFSDGGIEGACELGPFTPYTKSK